MRITDTHVKYINAKALPQLNKSERFIETSHSGRFFWVAMAENSASGRDASLSSEWSRHSALLNQQALGLLARLGLRIK